MREYVSSVRAAVADQNWYAGLTLALALPDICARAQVGRKVGAKDYIAWAAKYIVPRYTRGGTSALLGSALIKDHEGRIVDLVDFPLYKPGVFWWVGAADLYALRCAFLHEGSDNLDGQTKREALERFRFVAPLDGRYDGRMDFGDVNGIGNATVYLRVDHFCLTVCAAVEEWLTDVYEVDAAITHRIDTLAHIISGEEFAFGGEVPMFGGGPPADVPPAS